MIYFLIGAVGVILLLFTLIFDDIIGDGFGGDWLSGATIGGFIAAFGITGGLVNSQTGNSGLALGAGVSGGVVVGLLSYYLSKNLIKQEKGSNYETEQLEGLTGVVITSIKPGKAGEISVKYQGQNLKLHGKNKVNNEEIAIGEEVKIVKTISSNMAVVEKIKTKETE
jgi:membrane protein implicated in regulation of membrane protease activity